MSTALLFVWLFNGFWHGASWKYVLYGLYYYILMMIGMYCRPVTDKFISALKINTQSKPYAVFQMVRTFVIVNVGMMLFRAHDIGQWLAMLKNIFVSFNAINFSNGVMLTQGNDIQDFVAIIIGTLTVFVVELIQEKGIDIRVTLAKKNIALRYAVFLALIVVVFVFGAYGDNYLTVAPIYGQF
jgi:hypothetical protein